MFETFTKNTLVPLLLRFGLATVFIYHGLHKVGSDSGWGLDWDESKKIPGYQQGAVAWGELIGGVALAAGFLTRTATLGLAVIMAGAIYKVHGAKGFDLREGGYEYNFVLLVMLGAVFLLGPGTLALDKMLRKARAAAATP
jgi:putative oxidoreductase